MSQVIQIHRAKPIVHIDQKAVKLTRDEHRLLTLLGMMDNRLTPQSFLMDVLLDGRKPLPGDRYLLWQKISRLRRKIGAEYVQVNRFHGYILKGDVQFIGRPMQKRESR